MLTPLPPRLQAVVLFLILCAGCAKTGTSSLSLRYDPRQGFSSLQQKAGPVMALAPVRDSRPERLYIGLYTPLQGGTNRLKSNPSPLERAILESVSPALERNGLKTAAAPAWDGRPESLGRISGDSVLLIEVKNFWLEGTANPFKSNLKTSAHFVLHLGIKKERKVYTRSIEIERETPVFRLTPEKMEEAVNEILTEIFDSFFSNPFDPSR